MDGGKRDNPGGDSGSEALSGFRGELVVLDTNVLIAALIPRRRHEAAENASALVLRTFEAGHLRLCLSEAILSEYDYLAGRMPLVDRVRYGAVRALWEKREGTVWVTGGLGLDWCNDAADNKFLSAAAEGKAVAVLTSDKQLLSTGPRAQREYGFEVLPCRKFVQKILASSDPVPESAVAKPVHSLPETASAEPPHPGSGP